MGLTKQILTSLDRSNNQQSTLPLDSHMLKMVMNQASMNLAKALNKAKKESCYDFRTLSESSTSPAPDALANAFTQSRAVMQKAFSQQIGSRQSLGEKRRELVQHLRSPDASRHSQLSMFELEESILPNEMSESELDGEHTKNHASEAGEEQDIHGPLTLGKYTTESANTGLHVHKNMLSTLQGQPHLTAEAFKKSAAESAAEPVKYMGKSLVENGSGHFASTIGTNSVILPLGMLTLAAGIKEVRHSNHELKQLKGLRVDQGIELRSLQHAAKVLPDNVLEPKIQAQTIRLEKTQEAVQETSITRRIGITAITSGLVVTSKSLSTLVLNITLGIKSALAGKSFFALSEVVKYSPAAGAAAGLGLAGAFVFGPVGGLIAATLGTLFTVKTVKKLNQLKTDFELLKGDIRARALNETGQVNPTSAKLRDFLIRQADKRIGFFNRFSYWNKSFLISSGLYASSAITKATVTGLAIAGVTAAASNPIGLAVITAAAITATIGMGISSIGFFRGYGKQGKYSGATAADHDWVDRKLMTDLIGIKPTQNSPVGIHHGFDMAEACLKFLDT